MGDGLYLDGNGGTHLWGPGDRYRLLITGEQSGGAYCVIECFVPPGGGPPPHIHHDAAECFYLLEGSLSLLVGDETTTVEQGGFAHVPKGVVHSFSNTGVGAARMLATFSPAGMEGWFLEALDPCDDPAADPPPVSQAMLERMIEAGPRHHVEWAFEIPPAEQ
jgi:quercetin dioxygenase-like cupin family protein